MKKRRIIKIGALALLGTMLLGGQAYANWKLDATGWQFVMQDGTVMKNRWEWIDGNFDGYAELYYLDSDGYCLLDGVKDGKSVNENGAWTQHGVVQTWDLRNLQGWYQLNGGEVYLDSDGMIWRDRVTPDNFYVDEDGRKVTDSGIDEEMMAEKSQGQRYIVICKSSHHLELWNNGVKTHSFIITSGELEGDKERERDKRTPEGEFYVCKKVPNSQYHLALALNYPTIEDAERGLRDGLITQAQYNGIVAANERGEMPNWYTPLGGEIEIHGYRQPTDATRGCIGMRNEDIELLYSLVSKNDKVLILP